MPKNRVNDYITQEKRNQSEDTIKSGPISSYALIPLTLSILFPFNAAIITSLAIYYGHVHPLFPYLSDSGTTHPEAGYFSFLVSLVAIIGFACNWIRWKQIAFVCDNLVTTVATGEPMDTSVVRKVNNLSFGAYCVTGFSMISVCAFRTTEHLFLHCLFANGIFEGFAVIIGAETYVSYKLVPYVVSRRMARFRLLLTIVTYLTMLVFIITCNISFVVALLSGVPPEKLAGVERLRWDESWDGYVYHAISGVTEVMAVVLSSPFYGSFIPEFNRIYWRDGQLMFRFREVPNENIETTIQTHSQS